jgi:AcrR family transcriptional regulator
LRRIRKGLTFVSDYSLHMTDKQSKILEAALQLFATEGYNAVSTNRIAKQAGVSEGLIFRHFGNKQGLLDALVADVEIRLQTVFGPVLFGTEPQAVIHQIINIPFQVDSSDYNYWKLQFMLKWEPTYNKPGKMQPLLDKMTWAFQELGAVDPEMEARLLNSIIDNLAIMLVRNELPDTEAYQQFLLHKYSF